MPLTRTTHANKPTILIYSLSSSLSSTVKRSQKQFSFSAYALIFLFVLFTNGTKGNARSTTCQCIKHTSGSGPGHRQQHNNAPRSPRAWPHAATATGHALRSRTTSALSCNSDLLVFAIAPSSAWSGEDTSTLSPLIACVLVPAPVCLARSSKAVRDISV